MYRWLLVVVFLCIWTKSAYGDDTSPDVSTFTLDALVEALAENNDIKIMYPETLKSLTLQSSGFNAETISYAELLTVLNVHNYAMYKEGEIYVVKGKKYMRSSSIPLYTDGEKYSPSEIITKAIYTKNVCVSTLIPMLRPLVPQHAHFAGSNAVGAILITDIFSNIQRIESIIVDIDSRTKKQKKCAGKDRIVVSSKKT
ncbi:hypothetical protein [Marinagarivorans cellulosilyticus]|uniref:Secretin/TonB short N-terminal domain-containing protein n=1 Tax=Marinagarivorans cellulosilyticus TaxID=2721545 RepID=A0AAN2BJT4_9GAMM|nr:hypothetical protein [Marinagarivorans cellulosilyticus]BCD97338.1 hypothetical protein MARGE09_P1539 [Marinagarivorans cellulosilyticus]